jgi:hypothetical protein
MHHMDDFNVAGPDESSVALHTITSLPLDPQFPLFQHYPAMKLGVRESVAFFVQLLVPRAREILACEPDDREWVVTAPPLFAIPAAANLVAREICRELGGARGSHRAPRLVELRYAAPNPVTCHLEARASDYSRASVADRVKSRHQLYEGRAGVVVDPEVFRDRAVLFINDINVTGTQQHFMRRALTPALPASLHWLHVLQVDPVLGRSNPEVEYALNHLRFASFEEFAELVVSPGIEHTARCVDRLFQHDLAVLEPVFRTMGAERAKPLLDGAAEEGRWKGLGADYQTRIAVLADRITER